MHDLLELDQSVTNGLILRMLHTEFDDLHILCSFLDKTVSLLVQKHYFHLQLILVVLGLAFGTIIVHGMCLVPLLRTLETKKTTANALDLGAANFLFNGVSAARTFLRVLLDPLLVVRVIVHQLLPFLYLFTI